MKKRSTMGTTHATPYAKKWFPKGTTPGDENYKEYLPYDTSSNDPRIADRYGEEEREDDERVNQNDPFRIEKERRKLAKELGTDIFQAMKTITTRTPKKKAKEKAHESWYTIWEEYSAKIEKIDDFGNATISINGIKTQWLVYNARKIGLTPWMKREVLFVRMNKKGKMVFELPKNPQQIMPAYYDMVADGKMTPEEIIKKLCSVYGTNHVKEIFKETMGEEFIDTLNNDTTHVPEMDEMIV